MQFSISTIYFGVVIKTIGAPKDGQVHFLQNVFFLFCITGIPSVSPSVLSLKLRSLAYSI